MLSIDNITRATELGSNIQMADSFISRLLGLLPHKSLEAGEGLLLTRTGAVHTWGMRFPIDCLFLDAEQKVLLALPDLIPWRFSPLVRRACQVLELPSGTIDRSHTRPGDILLIKDGPYHLS